MKAWITRGKDSSLTMWLEKPEKGPHYWFVSTPGRVMMTLPQDHELGEGVTFENSPQEIEFNRKTMKMGG